MKKRVLAFLSGAKSKIPPRFRWRLPFFYGLGLILSLVLVFLYGLFPSLSACSKLFGQEFCTPAGIFLFLILSIPGYFVVGNLFPFLDNAAWIISFVLVVVASCLFYYLLGILFEKYGRASSQDKIKILVFSAFFVLLILLVLLLF